LRSPHSFAFREHPTKPKITQFFIKTQNHPDFFIKTENYPDFFLSKLVVVGFDMSTAIMSAKLP